MRCQLQDIRLQGDSGEADAETQTHKGMTQGGADSIWKLGICGGEGERAGPQGGSRKADEGGLGEGSDGGQGEGNGAEI